MTNATTTSKRILVISDEVDLCERCQRALTRQGYRVDVAATGQEGVAKVKQTDPDLVFLDVSMPDINGPELLAQILTYNPRVMCIVIAAHATVKLAVQLMKLGAYDLIEKPFSIGSLLLSLEQGLEKRRHQQEAVHDSHIMARSRELMHEKATLAELLEVKSASMRKVAHELRAPIAAIRSFLTLILGGYTTPEKAREMQERAAERADELLELVDDLLNLARLQDPKFVLTREMVSVEEILKDVLSLHAPEAEEKGIWLRVEMRPCGTILADPMHIKQLWTNLISNAIKYTPRGGQITVRLFPDQGAIVGMVKDTGIGIAKEDLPHLFDEFFRTEQAKALTKHGTGLGLPIVKQILEQYGGEIGVESVLGKSTQITFQLPTGNGNMRRL